MATMAILTIFVNVLFMEDMSEIHFSKYKCPGGCNGNPYNFCYVLVMKNMSKIQFSKCECPSSFNGDSYNFCLLYFILVIFSNLEKL